VKRRGAENAERGDHWSFSAFSALRRFNVFEIIARLEVEVGVKKRIERGEGETQRRRERRAGGSSAFLGVLCASAF